MQIVKNTTILFDPLFDPYLIPHLIPDKVQLYTKKAGFELKPAF